MRCARGTLLGPIYDRGVMAYARNDCKKLRCSNCGERKAKRYHSRVSRLALDHQLNKFWSLTLDPKKLATQGLPPTRQQDAAINPQSVDYLRKTWSKMRVYLLRRYPKFTFIAVLEFQMKNTGNAHLHLITDRWIEKEWFKEAWQACGGGIAWVEPVDVQHIPQYLAKYMTKGMLSECPIKKRVITTSRNLQLTEPPRNPDWTHTRMSVSYYFAIRNQEPNLELKAWIEDEHGLLYFETALPETPF